MTPPRAATQAAPADLPAEVPWVQVDPDIRVRHLGGLVVTRSIEMRIHSVLDTVRRARRAYPEPRNVVVHGETGVGKSDIMKRYLADYPDYRATDGNLRRPVLYVDVRNSSTPKAVAQEMLKMLGLRDCLRDGGTAEITRRVKSQLVAQQVELVIIDEFHNTLTDNGAVRLNRIAEWVKDLSKTKSRTANLPDGLPDENIPFVMVGVGKVLRIVDPTINPELASITPYQVAIDRYRYKTREEVLAFRQFLDDLDYELPFDTSSMLHTQELADKIHVATFGLLRQLGHLVSRAAELAIAAEEDRIYEHHLYESLEQQRGILQSNLISAESEGAERRAIVNPFTKPLLPKAADRPRKRGYLVEA
ncbi:MAG TPA: TniB family NTP-binding protein [Allosphingosinicella sp.]|jgi:Cdc6-like AAA superfamily ATPase